MYSDYSIYGLYRSSFDRKIKKLNMKIGKKTLDTIYDILITITNNCYATKKQVSFITELNTEEIENIEKVLNIFEVSCKKVDNKKYKITFINN